MLRSRLRDVIRVAGPAVPGHLGKNQCAALLRVLQFFEDHDSRTFPYDKSVAALIPGTAGLFGLVVARGKRSHRSEPAHTHRSDGSLGTAGNHDVGIIVLN